MSARHRIHWACSPHAMSKMRDFVELRFEPGTWGDKGFRGQGCWVRTATLDRVLEQGGELDIQDVIADLLDWLTIAPNRGDVLVTLSLPDDPAALPWADRIGSTGTLVLLEDLDRLIDSTGSGERSTVIDAKIDDAVRHLEFVFHRYLSGEKPVRKRLGRVTAEDTSTRFPRSVGPLRAQFWTFDILPQQPQSCRSCSVGSNTSSASISGNPIVGSHGRKADLTVRPPLRWRED